MRPVSGVLIEAAIVGVSVVPVMYGVFYGAKYAFQRNIGLPLTAFLTGFLIHVIFEYTGLNAYYCHQIFPSK